jgi:cell division protein FtsL
MAVGPAVTATALPQGERPPAPRPSGRMPRQVFVEALAAIALAAAMLLGATTATVAVAQAGYRLDRAQAALRQAQDEHRRLQVEVATLQAPDRIAAVASQQLGMHAPSGFDTVVPVAVQDPPPATPHAVTIAIAPVRPEPGSLLAIWDALRAFVGQTR